MSNKDHNSPEAQPSDIADIENNGLSEKAPMEAGKEISSEFQDAKDKFQDTQEDYTMTVQASNANGQHIHYVVGVGASAGGLEALQNMVANLPTDTAMSFVIAQHLSPSYKSMMVDLLEKDSTIPVVPARHQVSLEPNTIYICPPNYNIEISQNDKIILTAASQERQSPRPSALG